MDLSKPMPWDTSLPTIVGKKYIPKKCPHKRRRSRCKECRGGSICEHKKVRSECKECGGGSVCEHKRRRSRCKECGGGSICEHKKLRSQCKECGGGSVCEHKRRRSQCKECGGGSICEHKRERSKCKECGGGSVCEHKKLRSECKECLTIDAIIRRKTRCPCGAKLGSGRKNIGICAQCDKTQRERTEHKARRLLLLHMPPPYNLEASWSALDSQLIGSNLCQTGRRRPDMMIELEDRVVGVEIDENSHANNQLSCEIAKLDDHRWGAAMPGLATKPAVCVRINPDPRGVDDSVGLDERCRLGAEQLIYYAQCPIEELHALGTVVVYVCYGRNGQKHIDEAKRHPHFKVSVIG